MENINPFQKALELTRTAKRSGQSMDDVVNNYNYITEEIALWMDAYAAAVTCPDNGDGIASIDPDVHCNRMWHN